MVGAATEMANLPRFSLDNSPFRLKLKCRKYPAIHTNYS